MCGIAGFTLAEKYRGRFPSGAMARELLLGVEDRGKHATGYVAVGRPPRNKEDKLTFYKKDVPAKEFVEEHRLNPYDHTALLHTRHWTKGDPKHAANNHPVLNDTCFVVHNGQISNDDEVIKATGIERLGEVDSFAIPAALTQHGWHDVAGIKNSLQMLQGTFAIAVIDPVKEPGMLLLAKGDNSPLWVLVAQQGIFWSSSKLAITDAWAKVLGTPPTKEAGKSGELGFSFLTPGEWWSVDNNGKIPKVICGRFEVNRPAHNRQGWQPYRRKQHDWTCWPDAKNCVFSDDCGECPSNACKCYETNSLHPLLNDDVTFKQLYDKHPSFKTHSSKYKLTEELISRPRPTRASSESNRGTSSEKSTTPNLRMISSGEQGTTCASTKCFFCHALHPVDSMKRMNTPADGVDILYECRSCEASHVSSKDGDPKLRPFIEQLSSRAIEACSIVEAAIMETSWEKHVTPALVKYVCMFKPEHEADKDRADYLNGLRLSFQANIEIIRELRQLEAAK